MTVIICEIAWAVAAPANSASAAHRLRHAGATLPGLRWLDLYAPAAAAANDPYVQDGPAPTYLAMFAFPSLADLDRAANTKTFASLVSSLPVLTCSALRHLDFPTGDSTTPAPLTAPFSYVVRYHRPAHDEAAFVRNYLAGHPPLLARLPGIRNVMCYLPLSWRRADGPSPADYLIGNEVTFSDAASFDVAMASPIRYELRAHYHTLPRFSGHNTHFPMDRVRLIG